MNREFLKEAIADAKAVKETAIANAKAALEESFTPHLKTVLSAKLEEMEKEDMDEGYDEMDEAKDSEKMEEKKEYMTAKEKREGDDRKSDNKAETKTEKMRKIDEDEEMNLDEILAELEKDEDLKENARTDAEEEGYKDGMKDEKEDLKEDERTDAEEEGYLDGEKDEKEDMDDEDDEDIDLEDMSEEDLKKFIEDVIEDMVESGEIEAGESFEEDEEDVDVDIDVEDDVEVEELEEGLLNEEPVSIGLVAAGVASLLGGSAALSKALEKAEKGDLGPKAKKLADLLGKAGSSASDVTQQKGVKEVEDVDKIKVDLDEAMSTIEILKSELNEINLLNAKLLYTNKVFRGKNLTEAQKVKVLGAFDRAETVKEVKLVFETLNSSVKAKATNKSITEGVLAKGSASNLTATPKVTKKQPIVESNEMVNRFKKLAGLI